MENKLTYDVQFWYYTDLRDNKVVQALNDGMALSEAMNQIGLSKWADGNGFFVKIKLLDANC